MGDIWPYGPPRFTDWRQCYDALRALGFDRARANILAAIPGAESGYDLSVVNDTPATGDYSVGAWQVNYYGSLYAGRVAQFGRPGHLARSDVTTQARAARTIWADQGLSAWSTYTSGAYRRYLHGNLPAGPGPQHQLPAPDVQISPPTEDYSATIHGAAQSVRNLGTGWHNAATVLRHLRR